MTLTSKDTVRIELVNINSRGLVVPGALEEDTAWDDPAANTADFVVLTAGPTYCTGFSDRAVVATFGQPVRTYDVAGYQILVWPHTNLLTRFKPANGLAAQARGEMCAASQSASAWS